MFDEASPETYPQTDSFDLALFINRHNHELMNFFLKSFSAKIDIKH